MDTPQLKEEKADDAIGNDDLLQHDDQHPHRDDDGKKNEENGEEQGKTGLSECFSCFLKTSRPHSKEKVPTLKNRTRKVVKKKKRKRKKWMKNREDSKESIPSKKNKESNYLASPMFPIQIILKSANVKSDVSSVAPAMSSSSVEGSGVGSRDRDGINYLHTVGNDNDVENDNDDGFIDDSFYATTHEEQDPERVAATERASQTRRTKIRNELERAEAESRRKLEKYLESAMEDHLQELAVHFGRTLRRRVPDHQNQLEKNMNRLRLQVRRMTQRQKAHHMMAHAELWAKKKWTRLEENDQDAMHDATNENSQQSGSGGADEGIVVEADPQNKKVNVNTSDSGDGGVRSNNVLVDADWGGRAPQQRANARRIHWASSSDSLVIEVHNEGVHVRLVTSEHEGHFLPWGNRARRFLWWVTVGYIPPPNVLGSILPPGLGVHGRNVSNKHQRLLLPGGQLKACLIDCRVPSAEASSQRAEAARDLWKKTKAELEASLKSKEARFESLTVEVEETKNSMEKAESERQEAQRHLQDFRTKNRNYLTHDKNTLLDGNGVMGSSSINHDRQRLNIYCERLTQIVHERVQRASVVQRHHLDVKRAFSRLKDDLRRRRHQMAAGNLSDVHRILVATVEARRRERKAKNGVGVGTHTQRSIVLRPTRTGILAALDTHLHEFFNSKQQPPPSHQQKQCGNNPDTPNPPPSSSTTNASTAITANNHNGTSTPSWEESQLKAEQLLLLALYPATHVPISPVPVEEPPLSTSATSGGATTNDVVTSSFDVVHSTSSSSSSSSSSWAEPGWKLDLSVTASPYDYDVTPRLLPERVVPPPPVFRRSLHSCLSSSGRQAAAVIRPRHMSHWTVLPPSSNTIVKAPAPAASPSSITDATTHAKTDPFLVPEEWFYRPIPDDDQEDKLVDAPSSGVGGSSEAPSMIASSTTSKKAAPSITAAASKKRSTLSSSLSSSNKVDPQLSKRRRVSGPTNQRRSQSQSQLQSQHNHPLEARAHDPMFIFTSAKTVLNSVDVENFNWEPTPFTKATAKTTTATTTADPLVTGSTSTKKKITSNDGSSTTTAKTERKKSGTSTKGNSTSKNKRRPSSANSGGDSSSETKRKNLHKKQSTSKQKQQKQSQQQQQQQHQPFHHPTIHMPTMANMQLAQVQVQPQMPQNRHQQQPQPQNQQQQPQQPYLLPHQQQFHPQQPQHPQAHQQLQMAHLYQPQGPTAPSQPQPPHTQYRPPHAPAPIPMPYLPKATSTSPPQPLNGPLSAATYNLGHLLPHPPQARSPFAQPPQAFPSPRHAHAHAPPHAHTLNHSHNPHGHIYPSPSPPSSTSPHPPQPRPSTSVMGGGDSSSTHQLHHSINNNNSNNNASTISDDDLFLLNAFNDSPTHNSNNNRM